LELEIPQDVSAIDRITTVCAALTRSLTDQNERLAHTRDELIPLLLSGKVGVRDAETVLSEIV